MQRTCLLVIVYRLHEKLHTADFFPVLKAIMNTHSTSISQSDYHYFLTCLCSG